MDRLVPLTPAEQEHYIAQMRRRKKAKSMPENMAKFKKEYDEITDYLVENYKRFICGYILNHTDVSRDGVALVRAIDRAQTIGLTSQLNDALDSGSDEEFMFLCWCLCAIYVACVRDRLDI